MRRLSCHLGLPKMQRFFIDQGLRSIQELPSKEQPVNLSMNPVINIHGVPTGSEKAVAGDAETRKEKLFSGRHEGCDSTRTMRTNDATQHKETEARIASAVHLGEPRPGTYTIKLDPTRRNRTALIPGHKKGPAHFWTDPFVHSDYLTGAAIVAGVVPSIDARADVDIRRAAIVAPCGSRTVEFFAALPLRFQVFLFFRR
jgi:hypothetical protein